MTTMLASAVSSLHAAFNGSKLVWGLAAIAVNLGSRVVLGELTPAQLHLLHNPLVKRVVLVCIFFLPTRDLFLSVCLACVAAVLLEVLLNERSSYCILPERVLRSIPVAHRAPMMMLGNMHGHGAPGYAAPAPGYAAPAPGYAAPAPAHVAAVPTAGVPTASHPSNNNSIEKMAEGKPRERFMAEATQDQDDEAVAGAMTLTALTAFAD